MFEICWPAPATQDKRWINEACSSPSKSVRKECNSRGTPAGWWEIGWKDRWGEKEEEERDTGAGVRWERSWTDRDKERQVAMEVILSLTHADINWYEGWCWNRYCQLKNIDETLTNIEQQSESRFDLDHRCPNSVAQIQQPNSAKCQVRN